MDEARVTRSLELEAPTEEVWRAITDPAMLGDWLESVVELDVCPGGTGLFVEADGALRRACVEEVDPARRLALRWWPEDGSGPESRVELDLEATPAGTRLVVTETVVTSASPSTARQSATASVATAADGRWSVRLLLLGCCVLRSTVSCR